MTELPGYQHYGRSWSGTHVEDACPCAKESCGLVSDRGLSPDCEQHRMSKTIRQHHMDSDCPGPPTLEQRLLDAFDHMDSYVGVGTGMGYSVREVEKLVALLRAAVKGPGK